MNCRLLILTALLVPVASQAAGPVAVTDLTTYNAGSEVNLRMSPATPGKASIRYAGEDTPLVTNLGVGSDRYTKLWNVPWNARTGRYEIDITPQAGPPLRNAASFAVYRQRVKVLSVDLDRTFYTSGDAVNPRIVVGNVSNEPLDHLQVEFEAYTYPWISPLPDEPAQWKTLVAASLSLAPGETKEMRYPGAAVVQAGTEPVAIYYSVVIRDSRRAEQIYDLAFAPPAFTIPPNQPLPKSYPFLYLYFHERNLSKAEAYRNFYPPAYVSEVIRFDTAHTMFAAQTSANFSFGVTPPPDARWQQASLQARVLDAAGKTVETRDLPGPLAGSHQYTLPVAVPGLYTLEVSIRAGAGALVARNRLEFAVNPMPKSILIFCAHQDDDTAHPGLIRAALENHIPIHFVYFTGGDAGGCDRFYMHSCDAARAMDFGEIRMEEARASLGHLGVPRDAIAFLGLPDGGMEQIWYDHRTAAAPYLSVLLASDHSPYREAAKPNLPYSRDAVVAAARDSISRYQPDLIVTGHPDERHVDHRTNNWVVVEAMQELEKSGALPARTRLVVDQVYGAMPGRHAPYRYKKDVFYVSGECAKLGQEATWYYQSQDGNHQQGEIKAYSDLPRTEPYPHFEILDWSSHHGWNDRRSE